MTKSNRRRTLTEAQKRAMIRRKLTESARKKKSGNSRRVEAPYPHFRYYRKSGHPALIVGEQKTGDVDEYKYRKVMHSERDGNRPNEKVYPNPNPKDPEPMYIGKRVKHDEKKRFEEKPLPYIRRNKKSSVHKKPYLLAFGTKPTLPCLHSTTQNRICQRKGSKNRD